METPFCPSWFYRVFLHVEEYIGIEPTPPAWKAGRLTAIRILHGAPDRNRTCNLLITKQLLCLLSYRSMMAVRILPLLWKRIGEAFCKRLGDLYGNRTHVTAVKGPCLDRLTNRPYKDRLFSRLSWVHAAFYTAHAVLLHKCSSYVWKACKVLSKNARALNRGRGLNP